MSGDLHHLAAAYVLDALDERERTAFEAHYPTCEICRREVLEFRETAGSLAAATSAPPPARLEAAIMEEIARTRQASPIAGGRRSAAGRRRVVSPVLLAAAAVVVLVVAAVALVAVRGGRSPVEEVLAAPDAVVTTLRPTGDGTTDGASFQVVWSRQREAAAVIANELPDPGPDRVYALWAIVGETPVPAGLFELDGGSVRDTTAVEVDPTAWGVTVEPAGGSEAPTTPVLFFAESSGAA